MRLTQLPQFRDGLFEKVFFLAQNGLELEVFGRNIAETPRFVDLRFLKCNVV